ncbi:carboxymuconolactone decarboxylase family protein [Brevibacterium sanguinis]|uniref:Carboxymuconolactone decarboxylase family protein n=2 Tax=Brevibacterium TaxID=1696 RepID=A0A366IPU3_9MICO|nr:MULTISPECIES: carboxymuconolactone decarboxylase family protein [Brevibacterium]RBP67275.1 carboxymuconolactone decarboxylase family protein [Brevibacterium sanguinis]RBP73800.1 carboxymuconolactone decarboxylase family protein [Brevibacterium celere]
MNTIGSPNNSDRSSARIPLDKSGLVESALGWVSEKMYGKVLDPFRAAFHHRPVLFSYLGFELAAMRWKKLPQGLQALAVMTVAQEIGCSWCMDFGYWENHHRGIDPAKLRDVPQWRTSRAYTNLERTVMEYAAAATATPPTVTDDMVACLREDLTDAQVVELASLVSLENLRSRTNAGLGLTSQGFKAECEVPIREVS